MCSKGVRVQNHRKEKEIKRWRDKRNGEKERRLFESYITDRNERNRQEYMQKNQEGKIITRQKKNEVDERNSIWLSRKFKESKKTILEWWDNEEERKRWNEHVS